ncbi:MAG: class I adenylate-forming enzyme family protein [Alcaligenaceae bacterium]
MGLTNLGEVIDRADLPPSPWLIEITPDGVVNTFTFEWMHRAVDSLAHTLTKKPLKKGACIGLLAQNSCQYLVAYLAIMRAGFVAVPINFKLTVETIQFIISDAEIALVFADEQRRGIVTHATVLPLETALEMQPSLEGASPVSAVMQPEDTATILYTSGSTGRPKGVPLTHGGYVWVIQTLARVSPPFKHKRALVAAPLYHMNAVIQCLLTSAMGGTNVMLCQFSAKQYLSAAAEFTCEMLTAVPTMFALAARETALLERIDLTHVKTVKSGSAPVTEALMDRLAEMFPAASISNWWGTTESGPVAFGAHPEGLVRPKLAVGFPLSEVELELRDGIAPEQGVLWIRSRAITRGYLNLPEETAKRFADGWYNTGDVMCKDAQGFYYFVGRVDDMFVCGGENIYPGEVERMLERHPGVSQAAVLSVADEIKGQIPVAFIVQRAGFSLDADAVKTFALTHAPAYQHPRFVEFLEEMPLAGTNKIDRHVLIQRAVKFKR